MQYDTQGSCERVNPKSAHHKETFVFLFLLLRFDDFFSIYLFDKTDLSWNYCGNHFKISVNHHTVRASQETLVVKNLPTKAGDIRDSVSIPGSGRSPGGGHGNPLQYPCLENPMDRGVWRATGHGVAQSQTRLKQVSMHAACCTL